MSKIYSNNDYYEAIIQLRPKSKAVLDFIRKLVKDRDGVLIAKEVFIKTGVDIYITSQKYARSIGKKLKDNFNGDLKITKTLHTKDRLTSRTIYRGTVLFRLKE